MIVDDFVKYTKTLEFIRQNKILAIDTETTGLNVRKDKVIGVGIGNGEEGIYIPVNKFLPLILDSLKDTKLLAWNAYFDLEMIRNNFRVSLWKQLKADVVLLKHTCDENHPFKLKEVAARIFGHDSKKEQEELKASIKKNGGTPKEFFKADLEVLAKYCIQDCKLTYKLYDHYSEKLTSEGLDEFFYKDEVMPLYKEVTRFMQSKGVPVDTEKLLKAQSDIQKDIDKLEDQIQASINPRLGIFQQWFLNKDFPAKCSGTFAQGVIEASNLPFPKLKSGKFSTARKYMDEYKHNPWIKYLRGERKLHESQIKMIQHMQWNKLGEKYMFNLQSKFHLKKLFFDTLNIPPTSKTLLGNPQVDEPFLESINEQYPWVKLLQDYNKLNKLKSTYIDRIIDKSEEGIFYPSYQQHRTISGRYGSDLQQLPRFAELGQFSPLVTGYRNQIRSFFIAADNAAFLDADYESLEPHIFAHVSNEEKIREIFKKGEDFYSKIAIETESLNEYSANKSANNYLGNVDKNKRQIAKAYSLGIPYGMESYALAKTLKVEQSQAENLINNYLESFPALKNWMDNTDELLVNKGYILSEAGRKRRFSRAQSLLRKYGKEILNSLELWKRYNADPTKYIEMKESRKTIKNAMNNAKNFQIQSLAASIVNRATIAIARYMSENNIDGYVVAQVHDQIILHVNKKDLDKMKPVMQNIMETNYEISVPLKAPVEIGVNFAESH